MAMTLATVPAAVVPLSLGLIAGGSAVGLGVGKAVSPMALPQTVAAFHALVGAAAVATCMSSYLIHPTCSLGHKVGAMLGNFIGGVTFTGSLIAFGKLNANLDSKPFNLPNKNMLNAGMSAAQLAMLGMFCTDVSLGAGSSLMYATTALSSVMGVHLVGSVGGGDMPCCVTVLNSYSGWALVAEGMLLGSPTLTVVGSLIGFSGAILTKIMCDAMNRDILNVIFGGMQQAAPKKGAEHEEPKEHREIQPDAVASMLSDAKEVMVVPGYGMAVSQAQRAIGDIASTLRNRDINVRFSIHPVAGRMPGQMNVLLAEAGVPYEWVLEMDEVQDDMPNVDVCLVCGANDITNSAAETDEDCSIYGMPVIKVWEAKNCIFMKRSMAGGYADLENPVFFMENTQMLLGDAKSSCEAIAGAIKSGSS
jgi:NAD(P) transhydrogenase